jgi:Sec-independent protein translocase protein TatA
MDIFGIGPTEIVFILLLALILLGPKDLEKTSRTIGRFLRDLTHSDGWRAFRDTSREIPKPAEASENPAPPPEPAPASPPDSDQETNQNA